MTDTIPQRFSLTRSGEEEQEEQDKLKEHEEEAGEEETMKKEGQEEELSRGCLPVEEYELERARASYHILQRVQPWWCVGNIVYAVVVVATGQQSLAAGIRHSLLPLTLLSVLRLMSGPFKTVVEEDMRWYGIATQTAYFVTNMSLRALIGVQTEPGLLQHRVYLVTVFSLMIFIASVGYVPDRVFYFILWPSVIVSWLYFHIHVGYLRASSIALGFVVLVLMTFIRNQANNLNHDNFIMARELRGARQSLEQVMCAQQGMLSSFFDASCACDDHGRVTRLTPQMTQILGSCADVLVGRAVAEFAAGAEQKRLKAFMKQVWANDIGKTSMIQVSLSRNGQSDTGSGYVEARLYCVRLPDVSRVAGLEAGLWTHGGMFVGLQEVNDCSSVGGGAGAPSTQLAPMPLCQSVSVEHSIDFDAGSPDLDVVGCSTLFGCSGLIPEESKLIEMFPEAVATQIDEWVYSEVQAAPQGRASRSKSFVRSLNFQLPPSPGMLLVARKAWLEFSGQEGQDADIPVTLKMSGLRVCGGQRSDSSWQGQLDRIEENHDGNDGGDDVCSSDGEGSEACASTLMPDDSASQACRQRSLLFQPKEKKKEDNT